MKEMNREMKLNMNELEQVNGGDSVYIERTGYDFGIKICGYYARFGEEPPINYCEAGIFPPYINHPNDVDIYEV